MSNQIIILFFSQPTHPLTASRALPLPLGATALRPGVMVSHILGTVSHILGMHSRWCNSSLTWSWFREGGPPWWNSEKRGKCATLLPPTPLPRWMGGQENSSSWEKIGFSVCRSRNFLLSFFFCGESGCKNKGFFNAQPGFSLHRLFILKSTLSCSLLLV